MLAHTAEGEEGLRSEITRYITWPGQATAYKVFCCPRALVASLYLHRLDN